MNFQQFELNMLHRAGLPARLYPLHARRLLECALIAWQSTTTQTPSNDPHFRSALRRAAWQRYRDEYGFSPLAIMLLGAIINFLINWYFSDPHTHDALIHDFAATQQLAISGDNYAHH